MSIETTLLNRLTDEQRAVVCSTKRRVLVVAGAGSGKTEVMSRRVVWWLRVEEVPKESIAAFTFTEKAAEEMKFRIRRQLQRVMEEGEDATLGDMSVGTIHGFCLAQLRQHEADTYHNYDVIDEMGRVALVTRGYHGMLGLQGLKEALRLTSGRQVSQQETIEIFLKGYDLLNEYGVLDVSLTTPEPPTNLAEEHEWVLGATLNTEVGTGPVAQAFAVSAARYYAYLRFRRFLDFSTAQSECVRLLESSSSFLEAVRSKFRRVVVDEVQDINCVQDRLIRILVGDDGVLTAVGDHRQAIYGFRGGRVDLMATLAAELSMDSDGEVLPLSANFRSTPRLIELAEEWSRTISHEPAFPNIPMSHGNERRVDRDPTHCGHIRFSGRDDESEWIADTVENFVREDGSGVALTGRDGERGMAYGDIAVLLRSSTNARDYMSALERRGIPAIFRAGPDLFAQPEVLLFIGCLAHSANMDQFFGNRQGLPHRIGQGLGGHVDHDPESVIRAAADVLGAAGLPLAEDAALRLIWAAELLRRRFFESRQATRGEVANLRSSDLQSYLTRRVSRRVFPQGIYQLFLAEAEVSAWDVSDLPRGRTAMFHLGALSNLVKGIETPGWANAQDFKFQTIALCNWGARRARTEEAPLLVEPDAVTISTVHSAKGLQWPVVFLADVNAQRFPSNQARRQPSLPFDGPILREIDPAHLADNNNHDAERRLMYVAMTRAEQFLFLSSSGRNRSSFWRGLEPMTRQVGGTVLQVEDGAAQVPTLERFLPSEMEHEHRLVTSFSDLRYYLECPHDFFLRKVLGFAPTIHQAFGYGRAVHNLMRAVHSDPSLWAEYAQDLDLLAAQVERLAGSGLFYLRYTTGEPLENMRHRAAEIVRDYVETYRDELETLNFEPERPFETLLEEENVLIAGAIDLIRHDDPPRVTLIDFKSGDRESDLAEKIDEHEMRLQVSLYGLAARVELEYQPQQGLVRYLAEQNPEDRELVVPLDDAALQEAREQAVALSADIRRRSFNEGPRSRPGVENPDFRCESCDFRLICGRPECQRRRNG